MLSIVRNLFLHRGASPDTASLSITKRSHDEQFDLLRTELRNSTTRGPMGGVVMSELGGHLSKVGLLFTITQEQYLAWVRALPIDAFVSTEPHTFDGDYLVRIEAGWSFYTQERGMTYWEKSFATEAEAHEFIYRNCAPYDIFSHLSAA